MARLPIFIRRRFTASSAGTWAGLAPRWPRQDLRPLGRRQLFTVRRARPSAPTPYALLAGAGLIWLFYPTEAFDELSALQEKATTTTTRSDEKTQEEKDKGGDAGGEGKKAGGEQSGAWFDFSSRFESLSAFVDVQRSSLPDSIVDFILPEWSKMIPVYLRKLQRELSMAPGSLADEIWQDAHDPAVNPEIRWSARVRVSSDLCAEEKEFLARRRKMVTVGLARYLSIPEGDVRPEDVPVIAMSGSGGGLRALVAASGSMMATQEDGLLDCLTYTAGVSGSCWLQALYFSSLSGGQDIGRLVDHLKARLGVHIAYPPVAFQSLVSAPTNKYLLSGLVEKLRGDRNADFGLVDAYGVLLAARLLVPRGELGVREEDFKLSNQRRYLQFGEHPMPIYAAVRHEIPTEEVKAGGGGSSGGRRGGSPVSEAAKDVAKREAWFQWFEMTPYELFCEEFAAGVPTWAVGRRFDGGVDVPPEHGFHLPELRMPLLMGIFGSAFCATLSHYYREVRPIVRSISGLGAIDEMISGRNEDLSKVHPIDPARIPNFAYGMEGQLALAGAAGPAATESICRTEYLHLMDAGMSNNLPIYPLLRPGRNVDIVISFDASADLRQDNWLSVVDGYARRRGVKGWPVGIGWPRSSDSAEKTSRELAEAQASTAREADERLARAQREEKDKGGAAAEPGYCTVWVGSIEERQTDDPPPPPRAIDDASRWRLMEPSAGIAVIYLPLLPNPRVPGVNPGETDYLSTWNFVYTPDQIDSVVALAKANYDEGRDQIRACVRAVYERKKQQREEAELRAKEERFRRRVRRGQTHRFGEGDHFS